MMEFKEFTETVLEEIREMAGGSLDVRIKDITKNNCVRQTGICAVAGDSDIGPCIYLEGFYEAYENGRMELGEAVDGIYRLVTRHLDEMPAVDMSFFRNWQEVKNSIYAKLINAGQNAGLFGKAPHRLFLDMAVVYYVDIRDSMQKEIGTILILNEHMEAWGQEEGNLYRTAIKNMRTDGEADFADIETVVKRMVPDSGFPDEACKVPKKAAMYVLTNSRKRFGASEILDKRTLRMVADKVGDGFIVIPSSVHEIIVLPPKDEKEYGWLANMVRAVNDTEVDAEERLSDHVYAYSRDEEMLRIVA